MKRFGIDMQGPKDYIAKIVSDLQSKFDAEVSDWNPEAEPNKESTWRFYVTVDERKEREARFYCQGKFLKKFGEPTGRFLY